VNPHEVNDDDMPIRSSKSALLMPPAVGFDWELSFVRWTARCLSESAQVSVFHLREKTKDGHPPAMILLGLGVEEQQADALEQIAAQPSKKFLLSHRDYGPTKRLGTVALNVLLGWLGIGEAKKSFLTTIGFKHRPFDFFAVVAGDKVSGERLQHGFFLSCWR
jgi:hypothetical protein